MANALYDIAGYVVTFDGRTLTAFGETGITYSEITPKRSLIMGTGGSHVTTQRASSGKRVTINLMAGSADAAYMHAKYNATQGGGHTFTAQQIGTLETAIGSGGVLISVGDRTRASMTITEDSFVIEFPIWNETSGGEE